MPRREEPALQPPPIQIGTAALQASFNAGISVPRLVFLVSPTCGICVSGAQSAVQAVLSLPAECDFRLYRVWLPVLETDTLQAAEEVRSPWSHETRLVDFWDADLIISRAYHQVLEFGYRVRRHRVAWDIFLLYRAGLQWDHRPPAPSFWMHQLFLDDVPKLEAETLRHELQQMIQGGRNGPDESVASHKEHMERPPERRGS
jgi:hypothetical protein